MSSKEAPTGRGHRMRRVGFSARSREFFCGVSHTQSWPFNLSMMREAGANCPRDDCAPCRRHNPKSAQGAAIASTASDGETLGSRATKTASPNGAGLIDAGPPVLAAAHEGRPFRQRRERFRMRPETRAQQHFADCDSTVAGLQRGQETLEIRRNPVNKSFTALPFRAGAWPRAGSWGCATFVPHVAPPQADLGLSLRDEAPVPAS